MQQVCLASISRLESRWAMAALPLYTEYITWAQTHCFPDNPERYESLKDKAMYIYIYENIQMSSIQNSAKVKTCWFRTNLHTSMRDRHIAASNVVKSGTLVCVTNRPFRYSEAMHTTHMK